tara:strand:- start:175 stop:579 length:405 start_codon:yes stop_codon:yes gene_type:complete
MVTFRNNNNRRNNFRRNDRNFKNNVIDKNKFGSNFSNNDNFQRKNSRGNNQNASKLYEKYNNLAREALSSGDKILSENYFQHADHFKRILNDRENEKKVKLSNVSDIENKESSISEDAKKKDNLAAEKIQPEIN